MKVGDLIMDHDYGLTALVLEHLKGDMFRVLYEDGYIDEVKSGWGAGSIEVISEKQ